MKVTALDTNPGWQAIPGYRTLAIDGGAVRFQCPAEWIVAPASRYVCVLDRLPPQDRLLLALSWRRIPQPATVLSLPYVIQDLVRTGERRILERGPITRLFRPPLELAWTELRFVDPLRQRAAATRLCLARSGCTQALAAFDFRPEDGLAHFAVWNTFLRTLAVGETIADAATGRRRERWG